MEYPIPLRPYIYISDFIKNKLCKILSANKEEKEEINKVLDNRRTLISGLLPTIRDAKRFINQFVTDYHQVRGEVIFDEYLLVEILKYRYPTIYKSLYKGAYFKEIGNSERGLIFLKEELSNDCQENRIINILFPNLNLISDNNNGFRHIFYRQNFDNYFTNTIYSFVSRRELMSIFRKEWMLVTASIENWLHDEEKSLDFIDFITSFNINQFQQKEYFIRFAEILAYSVISFDDETLRNKFFECIQESQLESIKTKYKLNKDDYKQRIVSILLAQPVADFLLDLHKDYRLQYRKEKEYIIKDVDVWEHIKIGFIEATKETKIKDEYLLNILYNCIDHVEDKIILDIDCLCAYRDRLEKVPTYYIQNFVRLTMISSSPYFNKIGCEPFGEQIFGSKEKWQDFIKKCKMNNVDKSERAWNFWRLYRANDYSAIEYEGQGPVQAKIDDDLRDEIQKLIELRIIERKVLSIKTDVQNMSLEEKNNCFGRLSELKKQLEKVKLYITARDKVFDILNKKQRVIKSKL